MSKSDEAFERWIAARDKSWPPSADECWDAGSAYQKEQDLAVVDAVRVEVQMPGGKTYASDFWVEDEVCDEIARRIKES